MILGAKSRAKRNGLPFDIDPEDVPLPIVCPVLGVPFVLDQFRHDYGPSLDRKIPELGYVKGNVFVICSLANRMKSNATVDQIRALIAYMED